MQTGHGQLKLGVVNSDSGFVTGLVTSFLPVTFVQYLVHDICNKSVLKYIEDVRDYLFVGVLCVRECNNVIACVRVC